MMLLWIGFPPQHIDTTTDYCNCWYCDISICQYFAAALIPLME